MFLTEFFTYVSFRAMNQIQIQARNMRLLLWRQEEHRDKWPARLASWLGIEIGRARELLLNGGLTDKEAERLSETTKQPTEELLHADFVQGTDVLRENLKYLLSSLPHGKQKEVAGNLGVDATTVSRWRSGTLQNPTPRNLEAIKTRFNIPPSTDLSIEPIFLDMEPLLDHERRNWLLTAIKNLESTRLRQYFPALRKLLGE